tara:strand:- start:11 stop:157 length:147 start_codon:yes stop_codon:yes gene_type:complete
VGVFISSDDDDLNKSMVLPKKEKIILTLSYGYFIENNWDIKHFACLFW